MPINETSDRTSLELGHELEKAIREVNSQIEAVRDVAHAQISNPYKLVDAYGNFKMAPLLVAKAQLLFSLNLINKR